MFTANRPRCDTAPRAAAHPAARHLAHPLRILHVGVYEPERATSCRESVRPSPCGTQRSRRSPLYANMQHRKDSDTEWAPGDEGGGGGKSRGQRQAGGGHKRPRSVRCVRVLGAAWRPRGARHLQPPAGGTGGSRWRDGTPCCGDRDHAWQQMHGSSGVASRTRGAERQAAHDKEQAQHVGRPAPAPDAAAPMQEYAPAAGADGRRRGAPLPAPWRTRSGDRRPRLEREGSSA